AMSVVSTFDLTPVAEATGADQPWRTLACPAGEGQLLLDAIAAEVTNAELGAALEAERDGVDGDGCRPATGLDALLAAAFTGAGPLADAELRAGVASARAAIAAQVELRSSLASLATGTARHRLHEAVFVHGAQMY